MTPAELTELIRAATTDVLVGGGTVETEALPKVFSAIDGIDWAREIARPRDPSHGEYTTTVALRAASALDLQPRELAGALATTLARRPGIASAEVAGSGFVNLRLDRSARAAVIDEVLTEPPRPGWAELRVISDEIVSSAGAGFAELVARVGPDVARYAVLRSPNGRMRLDPALLARHVDENPAYRVRFAHARLCALARHAEALGVALGKRYELLSHPREDALIRALGEWEISVGLAAERREPYRLARYLERLADELDRFELACRTLPMGDEPVTDLHRARRSLAAAVRGVLKRGLDLLGVSAPERM